MSSAEYGKKPIILETVILRLEADVECVSPMCPEARVVKAGQDALQSPSSPGFFYHIGCFKALIRSTGRDPDKYLRIIYVGGPSKS